MESRACRCPHQKVGTESFFNPASNRHFRIWDMDLATDAAIDWEMLRASFQNVWNARVLQRKWDRLKSSIEDFQDMTHRGSLLRFLRRSGWFI